MNKILGRNATGIINLKEEIKEKRIKPFLKLRINYKALRRDWI